MHVRSRFTLVMMAILLMVGMVGIQPSKSVEANNSLQNLPFSQDWTNINLISTNDDWSLIPGIIGFRGDNLTSTTGVDPQTVLSPDSQGVIDVIANQLYPNTNTQGGVAEFHLENPVVALQGSGTADAPYLLMYLNSSGFQNIVVSYLLRDIDGSEDNSVQPVALHYRVGGSGNFINVADAYIADASAGPGLTKETPVSVTLPAEANNQMALQLRIMTTNAVGNDEWIGIDNISITGTPLGADLAPTVASTAPADGGTAQKTDNIVITFSEPVTVEETWFSISCTTSDTHTATVTDENPVFTLDPDENFHVGETCAVTVLAENVTDDDLIDPPDAMVADHTFSFTIAPGCGDTFTRIYDIQGTGETSPLAGQTVTTEGVVVGDFQVGGRAGYYIQDPTGDNNTATSDGIFIYNTATDVNVGDHVRVRGTAGEFNGLTQISLVSQVWVCSTGETITPTEVTLPVEAVSDFEKYEGMLVTFPQSLIISE